MARNITSFSREIHSQNVLRWGNNLCADTGNGVGLQKQ
jgi:hypothetical protein